MILLLLLALSGSAAEPGVHRLGGGTWRFKQDNPNGPAVETLLPGLQRVVVLPGKPPAGWVSAAAWRGSGIVTGLLDEKALSPSAAASPEEERDAALADAAAVVTLAGGVDGGYAPDFTAYRAALNKKLACLTAAKVSGSAWEKFKKLDAAGLSVNLADKPETLRRLKAFAFAGFDPKTRRGGTLSSETLVVPLSVPWFKTSPALEKYFRAHFADGTWDARFVGGGSGEGITRGGKDDTFEHYQKKLLALRDFTAGLGDAAVSATPEHAWLQGLSEASLAGMRRMIFIHEHTWSYAPGRAWAEYIAVDQSFGPVAGQPLFSVLIHEINVNSSDPQFLPSDTHAPREDAEASWKRAAAEGPAFLKDAREASVFLALNPLLGAAALGYHLDALARASGSCR